MLGVKNFRSIKEEEFFFDDLSVLIGRNNTGKTNVLQAVAILLEGTARNIDESDYWDESEPIVLECDFHNVDKYLHLCSDKNRTKVQNMLKDNGILSLRRSFGPTLENSAKLMTVDSTTGADKPLGTGIDAELKRLLPEVVHIPALADVTEETTAASGSLRGIVKQVLASVREKAQPVLGKAFQEANGLLNVVEGKDVRVAELRDVENDVTNFLRETFAGSSVHLRVDFPDIQRLLAEVAVDVNDGDLTSYARKGHGLQRCLYLSLLRALAKKIREGVQTEVKRPIIILFEEPELFLHPSAQEQMRDALHEVSKKNQVVLATHSPSMVSLETLSQLIVVTKTRKAKGGDRVGFATVTLTPRRAQDVSQSEKDLLSILNLHRSSRLFFADRVLLVEGPSDVHLLNAIAERLGFGRLESKNCTIVEMGTKDKLRVGQEIVGGLGIETYALTDLDFLWRGAGEYLKDDPELSRFCERLADQTKAVDEDKRSDEKRRLTKADLELKAAAGKLAKKLVPKKVFVLVEGEIEDYVGLSKSSKGEYVTAAHEIVAGTRELKHQNEISTILRTFLNGGGEPRMPS
jgi:putative ATP-dependent endonuclease of OLD family